MKKKKVLFTATVVKTHLMQFHIPYLKMFQQMGWETAVASRNDYEDPADCRIPYCDTYYDVPFERLPWKKQNIKAYRMLKTIINEGEYDIIHCHTPVGAMLTRLAARSARKKGTKVIYTAHGFHFFKGASVLNWLTFYPAEWLLSPLTDVLVTINKEDYALARRKFHCKRIEYVPGVGVDTKAFQRDVDQQAKRQELGFREDDFLMLTVAEMTANKNHLTVLKAMARLKEQPCYEKLHYLIVGRGKTRPMLEKAAKELGIFDHVHFMGYRNDAPDFYRCCDLFAFVSFREGLSVALMEAMSSGMCIVCTKIRGNTDLIDDGVSGIFTENNAEALAEHIQTLAADPELRAKLGQGAEEKVKTFDNEAVHRQMKEIYLSLS